MTACRTIAAVVLAALSVCCRGTDAKTPAATAAPENSAASISTTGDPSGDWVIPAKDYSSTRYSALTDITTSTVKQLGVKLTFSTGVNAGHEAAPLVVNNTMFVVTPWPNIVYALDLTRPGAPLKWKYAPKPVSASRGVACCDVVNRGAAYADGAIFFNT